MPAVTQSAQPAPPELRLPGLLAPVNRLLTPGIRCGLGNPLPLTTGLIVLEVTGRRSGALRTVPLVCSDFGATLVVSTVRDNSQWLKNLAAAPTANVWLRGRRRLVRRQIYRRGEQIAGEAGSRGIAGKLARSLSRATGSSIVLLELASRVRPAA